MSTDSNSMNSAHRSLQAENSHLTPILLKMCELQFEKEKLLVWSKIVNLENKYTELSDQVLKLEMYKSNDCLDILYKLVNRNAEHATVIINFLHFEDKNFIWR